MQTLVSQKSIRNDSNSQHTERSTQARERLPSGSHVLRKNANSSFQNRENNYDVPRLQPSKSVCRSLPTISRAHVVRLRRCAESLVVHEAEFGAKKFGGKRNVGPVTVHACSFCFVYT